MLLNTQRTEHKIIDIQLTTDLLCLENSDINNLLWAMKLSTVFNLIVAPSTNDNRKYLL